MLPTNEDEHIDTVYEGMLQAFGADPKIDVVIKKQNTKAFLDVARVQWLKDIDAAMKALAESAVEK